MIDFLKWSNGLVVKTVTSVYLCRFGAKHSQASIILGVLARDRARAPTFLSMPPARLFWSTRPSNVSKFRPQPTAEASAIRMLNTIPTARNPLMVTTQPVGQRVDFRVILCEIRFCRILKHLFTNNLSVQFSGYLAIEQISKGKYFVYLSCKYFLKVHST